MAPRDRDRTAETEWLTLGEAGRVLGVSNATVRRWADSGGLGTFTTPGGHRRFSRAMLDRLLPDERRRHPALAAEGLTQARLSRAYRRGPVRPEDGGAWLASLSAEDRKVFAEMGRRLARTLLEHLDADEAAIREARLAEAVSIAAEYGRRGSALDLSMSEVIEGFLAFRRPFLGEMAAAARRRSFGADEIADLFVAAEYALDRLLVATMSGHSTLNVGRRRSRRSGSRTPTGVRPATDRPTEHATDHPSDPGPRAR